MRTDATFRVLLLPLFGALASCGGGGGGSQDFPPPSGSGTWQPNVFQPSTNYDDLCVSPRAGTADRQGSRTDENNWLRSWTNELYLWYGEVTDRDPSQYATDAYFNLMKTSLLSPSGQPKDKFHFTYDTAVWQALSQGGQSAGYGAEFEILSPYPPRRIVVAYTVAGTAGASQFARGDDILQVDGVDVANGSNTQVLNAGLFPDATGESHSFLVRVTPAMLRTRKL